MDVQSSGQLHFHQHPQIPPETGDLSRGPLWRHPIFRTSGNCQCGYDPDELYVSALWWRCDCGHVHCQPFYVFHQLCHYRLWPGLSAGMQLLLRRRTLRPREESLLVLHPCKHHYPSGTQRDQFPGSPLYYHTIPTQWPDCYWNRNAGSQTAVDHPASPGSYWIRFQGYFGIYSPSGNFPDPAAYDHDLYHRTFRYPVCPATGRHCHFYIVPVCDPGYF